MKKHRLIFLMLLVSVALCLTSCKAVTADYFSSLNGLWDYHATVEYDGVCYTARITSSCVDGSAERTATLALTSPDELNGMSLTVEKGVYTLRLDGVDGVGVELDATAEMSPLVRALELMSPSAVIGATLGGEYNEIVTEEATYYTDKNGDLREIYSDGLRVKLSRAEKNE